MTESCTYIVLLNWNGWKDTIACLESVFQSSHSQLRVVVCDNASSDDSLTQIAAWARGEVSAALPEHPRLRAFMRSATDPIEYSTYSAADVRSGSATDEGKPLILIDNEENLGFAAGNNTGLRFALAQTDMTHVWILNNDTLVDPDCLSMMQRRLSRESAPAVCGSIIHFFDQPECIQAIGGNCFNRRTGVAMQSEGRFRTEHELADCHLLEEKIDYLSGCSWMLPRIALEKVGLLNEDYFLYYEEIDWFSRAGSSFRVLIAPDAHVYHREGGSIGSPSWRQATPSLIADFHIFRSKLLFMRKYHPRHMVGCYLTSFMEVGKRLLRGQFSNARVVLSVLFGASSYQR